MGSRPNWYQIRAKRVIYQKLESLIQKIDIDVDRLEIIIFGI